MTAQAKNNSSPGRSSPRCYQRHYSVVSDPKQDIVVCACSPERRRTLLDWARHVSDQVARKLG
jgi:hypothetical protein